MRCADLRARARDYFEDELAADVREACDAHLSECAPCGALFARGAALAEPDFTQAFGVQWRSAGDLTCAWVLEFLAAYLEQGLDPRERASFDAHLDLCEACRTYLTQYSSTVRLARHSAAESTPVPPALVEAILAARRAAP